MNVILDLSIAIQQFCNPTILEAVLIANKHVKWVKTDPTEIFFIEIQREGIILASMCLC